MRTSLGVTMSAGAYQGYLIGVARYMATWKRSYPRRIGQSFFNVLDIMYPEIAAKIRGTLYDPFYDDDRIGDFLAHLFINYVTD
jgi:hypothetical protein